MYTDVIYITLSYKHTLYIKVAYTSYFTSSLNIFAGKTSIPNFGVPFTHLFMGRKPYYNSNLFLNGSINPINISL